MELSIRECGKRATHFRLRSLAAVIDFSENICHSTTADTAALPLDATTLPALHLGHTLAPTIRGPVLLLLGIEFLQMVNGTLGILKDSSHKALAIVSVERGMRQAESSAMQEVGEVAKLSVFLPLN